MTEQERLDDLLDRWEEAREKGREISAEELCQDCPELATEVEATIRDLKRTDWLFEPDEDDVDYLPLPPVESLSAQALVPASVTLDKFSESIVTSGVLTTDELTRFDASDAQDLAAHLLRSKQLTKYQAKLIAEGNTKGLVLGNYVILDQIGAGGMGQVFKARHRRMDRVVALKVLPREAVESPTAVQRFHQEVRAAAKLEHQNIVTAFDADEADGTHFLVMQFVDGHDLASLVRSRGPMSVARAVDCVVQAARGLEYAHRKGIVHRDIKPANLVMDNEGTVKILDMGLARLEATGVNGSAITEAQLTQDGNVMGTVDFMSPEQAMDTHNADARSDIYSLGCTLFYLLTGKPMYVGKTLFAKMTAHKEDAIPALQKERDGVPAELSAVFEKMVAKQPDNRYQTAGALVDDLASVAETLKEDVAMVDTVSPQDTAIELQSRDTSSASLDETLDMVPPMRPVVAETVSPAPKAGWNRMIGGGVAAVALAIFGGLYMAGVLFKVETPEGIIQIESNVTDFEVFVDNEKVVYITDPKDKGKVKVEVKPGAKMLTVSKDGFEAEVAEFQLKTVEGPIKVTFVPRKEASGSDDVERTVAQKVLQVGGTVVISVDGGEPIEITKVEDLPSGGFHIVEVRYIRLEATSEDFLTDLLMLKRLETLNLYYTPVSDERFASVADLVTLKHLNCINSNRTDDGLKYLQNLKNLETLRVDRNHITDSGLRHLQDFPKLTELNVGLNPIGGSGLAYLGNLKKLDRLHLRQTRITDTGLEHLMKMEALTSLELQNTKVTAEGVAALKKALPDCEIKWDGNVDVHRQVAEWVLSVGGFVLLSDDAVIENRDDLPSQAFQLKAIDLREDAALDRAGIELLARLDTPIGLTFYRNPNLSDEMLKMLKDVSLTGLLLTGTSVTDDGLQWLHLEELSSIYVDATNITDTSFQYLASAPKLLQIKASGTRVTDEGISHFVQHPLNYLVLDDCTAVTDKSLEHISKWHEAAGDIFLANTGVSDAGLSYLSNIKVKRLHLAGTEVTKQGVFAFQKAHPNAVVTTDWASKPDQRAAYWAIASGGTVIAEFDFDTGYPFSRTLRTMEDIPDEPFRVTGMKLQNPAYTSMCAGNLAGVEHLRRLDLSGTQVPPNWINPHPPSLSALSVNENGFAHYFFSDLPRFHNLTFLEYRTPITNEYAEKLKELKNLRYLDLTDTKLSAPVIRDLQYALPNCLVVSPLNPVSHDPDRRAVHWLLGLGGTGSIRRLDENGETLYSIEDYRVIGSGTEVFDERFHLETASLGGLPVFDFDLDAFEDSDLPHLDLQKTGVTDDGMRLLADCKVGNIGIAHTAVTDEGVKYLAKNGVLVSIRLGGNLGITDDALKYLSATNVTYMDLGETNITDAGLQHLRDLATVKTLDLNNTKTTDAGLEHLKRLKELETLNLVGTAITDGGMQHLCHLERLKDVDLANTGVTKTGVEQLLKALPSLERIRLLNTPLATDHAALAMLQQQRPDCIIDAIWSHPVNLVPTLWVLRLNGSLEVVIEDGEPMEINHAEAVPDKPHYIVSINFTDNQFLNDACVTRFKDIEGLKKLLLQNTGLTDSAIEDLKTLKALEEINLTGTKITAEGIEAIRTALPKCKVVGEAKQINQQD